MEMIYNKTFFNEFYEENGGGNYMDRETWIPFFQNLAREIVERFEPKTVLDAGCARGYLVECLRDLGVEAYGFDLSDYAIANVREDIQEYCFIHSITDPIPSKYPQKYDLIITIEVLEHLFPEDGERAIANLCSYTDRVIFSSTPDDIEDKTHVNVRLPEYWAKLFFENEFNRDLYNDVSFVSPWCVMFERLTDISKLIFAYEMTMRVDTILEEKERKFDNKKNYGSIYYDKGNGFNEEDKIEIIECGKGHSIEVVYIFPEEMKSIRFDLNQQQYCILKNIEIYTDYVLCDEYRHNGIGISGGVIFDTRYPQLLVEHKVSALKIRAMYLPVEEEAAIIYNHHIGKCSNRITEQARELEMAAENAEYLRENAEDLRENIEEYEKELLEYKKLDVHRLKQIQDVTTQLDIANNRLNITTTHYESVVNSTMWKATKPLRVILDVIKKKRSNWKKLTLSGQINKERENIILLNAKCIDNERTTQQQRHFATGKKFSIVVPLYNTPNDFLIEMIESVRNQTYGNWELCMADGSDDAYKVVGKICKKYTQIDPRIKYMKLQENLGISGNTNACLTMATGEYIALFDHDDLLHPSVLYKYMEEIEASQADFLYCDEFIFQGTVDNVVTMHFKPDFAIDNLRANNYICHFTVFSKSLITDSVIFRKEYDGSQDHDMILRLTDKAARIAHIPEVLYFWRSHPNSVAADINSKTYAIQSGINAVSDHLRRCGYEATVESTPEFPVMYKINYEIVKHPLVSIIIIGQDDVKNLSRCIESIESISEYNNYEIIIVDNNSISNETLEYYRSLEMNDKVKIIRCEEEIISDTLANNYGAKFAQGEHLLFLSRNTEIISKDLIERMLMYSMRSDVGAVGGKLYHADGVIRNAGIIIGMGEEKCAGYCHDKCEHDNHGYMGRLCYAQNMSALSVDCLMIERYIYDEVNGFDSEFVSTYYGVDMCLRLREIGYLNVWTPFAELYYYETSRSTEKNSKHSKKIHESEVKKFQNRWKKILEQGDPYFNPNFSLEYSDFRIKS